jgi:hypothetical protein
VGNRSFTCCQAGAAKDLHGFRRRLERAHQDWSTSPDFEFAPSCFRMVLQAPAKFRNAMKKESTFSIIWDSGASISISPNKEASGLRACPFKDRVMLCGPFWTPLASFAPSSFRPTACPKLASAC